MMEPASNGQPACPRLLVAQEVAAILRVKVKRVYELIRNRDIPTVVIGSRQVRIPEDQLREWIASGGVKEAQR
jgi:excisionase family DNA binding protein